MGSRVLLTAMGSLGDLLPWLAVGAELRRRGHTVVVAAAQTLSVEVEGAGFEFHSLRPNLDFTAPEMLDIVFGNNVRKAPKRLVVERFLRFLPEHCQDVWRAAEGVDLIVTHSLTCGASLVAEAKNLPWAVGHLSPMWLLSVHEPTQFPGYRAVSWMYSRFTAVRPLVASAIHAGIRSRSAPIAAMRRRMRLPQQDNPGLGCLRSPYLTLAMFSSTLARPQPDWPPHAVVTGFCWPDSDEAARLPAALTEFLDAGPPPVVFTLGSAAVYDPRDFYVEGVAAARHTGQRAVLLTAGAGGMRVEGNDVFVAGFLDHRLVFPRAAAIVCSAGIGTLAAALRSGRPFVAVTHGFDQPDNAYRCQRLGVSRTVARARYRRDRVAAALQGLLSEHRARSRATVVAETVTAEDGGGAACDALEKLL